VYAGDEFGFCGVKEECYGGDDAVRPEFGSPPMPLDPSGARVWALHQYLIGLRRRHSWLHAASTTTLRLDNRRYVYQTAHLALADLGVNRAEVLAGSAALPQEVVDAVVVEPHGWRILRPV
jgi:cyclomaltodextrinase